MNEGRLRFDAPRADWLSSYEHALEKGWSPDNIRDVSAEQLEALRQDPSAFLASLVEQGGVITLPDGSTRPKLPFIRLWLWDGEFCGTISLRWMRGTDSLPAHVLGHVGYAIVPWKRGRGYASEALGVMLERARAIGLKRVEITTDPRNEASRRVIEKNGGHFIGTFVNEAYGAQEHVRYAVELKDA